MNSVIIGISSAGAVVMILISIMIAAIIVKRSKNTKKENQKSNQGKCYHEIEILY